MDNPAYSKSKNPLYDNTRALTIIMENEREKTRITAYQSVKFTVITCIINMLVSALIFSFLQNLIMAIVIPIFTTIIGYRIAYKLVTECSVNDINFILSGGIDSQYIITEEDAFDIIRKLCERRGFAKGMMRTVIVYHLLILIMFIIEVIKMII